MYDCTEGTSFLFIQAAENRCFRKLLPKFSSKTDSNPMKVLKQYVEVLDFFKIKKQELNTLIGEDSTKTRQFFEGIFKDKWQTEDEAAAELFGKDATSGHGSFRVLKTELKKRLHYLMGGVMDFKQPDKLAEFAQVYYITLRQQAILKILSGRGKSLAAFDLALSLCELAKKYDLSEPVIASCLFLKRYYLTMVPDPKKYNYYKKLYEDFMLNLEAERLAEDFFIEIVSPFIEDRSTKTWLKPTIEEYIHRLKPYDDKVNTVFFIHYSGLLNIWLWTVTNDYEQCLLVCDKYIGRLTEKNFRYDGALLSIIQRKAICCIMLKRYEQGLDAIEQMNKLLQPHTHNWYNNGILQIQFFIHTQDYKQALKKCIELVQSSSFDYQITTIKEELKIYEAYIQWLVAYGKIQVTKIEQEDIGKFRMTRIVNELPTFSKDKKGMNIPILMLQVLWLLAEKRYDDFLNRLEALSKYKTRYLKEDENLRTNLMIKLLHQIPENGYDKRKISQKTAKTLEYLINTQSSSHEIEVFPYDIYWKLLLEII